MDKKVTVRTLREMKSRGEKIVMLTAYDAVTARWAESAGCQMLLVGDSMANTVLGYENTIPLTLDESIFHTAAVRRGAKLAFVVGDMPFMTYQLSVDEAVRNAGRYLKECGADAVKLEGGLTMLPVIKRLVEVGIPVVGHIGLLPQSVLRDGGYRIHGRAEAEAASLMADAKALDEAGVCALVLEGIPRELSEQITAAVSTPTIGIGAGAACDGQVQVIADLLGMGDGNYFVPRHAKKFAQINDIATAAIAEYVRDVQAGVFPAEGNSVGMQPVQRKAQP
ncbi:MAG: 3-methyl-2-oxobutanoate hydroxymethyltransferase, partial [Victivallales bacterium]|nr:3-methyl-2-oxobutanoate hydroxymethyltransferase [Victivallales bacterium]